MPRRRPLIAALLGLALAPATASADPAAPMTLPGAATAARVPAQPGPWLVGARPGPAARAVARRFGARHFGLPETGGYSVPRARARALAAALDRRGLLVYAQPDTLAQPQQAVLPDPLSRPPDDWRSRIASPELTPPAVTEDSPLIALVDAAADATHPEWSSGSNFRTLGGRPVTNLHGTATAAVAAAPANGVGIVGVWPGARALNVPLPDEISCRDSADQIAEAVKQGAAVVNMSYGSRSLCFPEYVQLQFAVGRGIVPVAAAGNDFAAGNPLEYPASLPHVLTVAATDAADRQALFSNVSEAVDLSAPGQNIQTAVPRALDDDGRQDGYERLSGTSFAAPMVAAATAWVLEARPELRPDQVAQVVRQSARDVGRRGWDALTGFGVLDVGAALQRTAPRHDPFEPNDNLVWVNGRAFSRPDAAVWSGRGATRIDARLDRFEDPADVYRIAIPARRTVRVVANPGFGDVELSAFSAGAMAINDTGDRLARSARRGAATERIRVRNTGGRRRTVYVAVRPQGTRSLDARYRLTVR